MRGVPMIHDECLAEMTQLLRAEADKLAADADQAAATPRLRIHEETLRRQANGLCYAIGHLREIARRQRVGV